MSRANIFFEIPLARSILVFSRAFWWALSSSGRAPHLQCGGDRFESGRVHQNAGTIRIFYSIDYLTNLLYSVYN